MARKNNKVRLILEALEDRLLMSVSAYASNRTIVIETSGDSTVDAYRSDNDVIFVEDVDTRQTVGAFAGAAFDKILFKGGSGNDDFVNDTNLAAEIYGSYGHDRLEGGSGNDTIYGGTGDDTLIGYTGNDNLYGGLGRDYLRGDAGLDGLFGGVGLDEDFGSTYSDVDTLIGGSGADRFLTKASDSAVLEDQIQDKTDIDASVLFIDPSSNYVDGKGTSDTSDDISWAKSNWTDQEVQHIDTAFRNLHHLTSNTKFVRYGRTDVDTVVDLQFRRYGSPDKSTNTLGWNWTDTGKIDITNRTYNSSIPILQTIYHELAHNFDDTHENPYILPFQNLSGWVQGDPGTTRPITFLGITIGSESTHLASSDSNDNWYYHRDAKFAREYGKDGPFEDFATSFAAYILGGSYSGDGEVSYKSANIYALVDWLKTPSKPTLSGPSGQTNDRSPWFTWTEAANSARYELLITNTTTGATAVYETQIQGTSYRPATALAYGSYRIQVRAVNINSAAGEWSNELYLTIAAPMPATPTLLGPTDSTTDKTPTFRWNAAANADSYELYVWNNSTNSMALYVGVFNGETSHTHDSELALGSYTFWVRAYNGRYGDWSAAKAFSIESAQPATATLIGPSGAGADNTPTFKWNAAANATWYRLYVYNNTTHTKVIDKWVQNSTAYTHSTTLAAGNCTFWVQTWGNGQFGKWSAGMSFTIESVKPATATLIGPGGSTTDATPTFRWNAASNASWYRLYVYNYTTGNVEFDKWMQSTTYSPTSNLSTGNHAFWVQTWGNGQYGKWSSAMSFEVAQLATPAITGPAKFDVSWRPEFKWQQVAGAVRYELWVDNLSTGKSAALHRTNLTSTSFKPSMDERLFDGKYRAWLRAFDASGQASNWSTAYDFTIGPRPAPVVVGQASSKLLALNWKAVEGAARYELRIVKDPATANNLLVVSESKLTGNSYAAKALSAGKYLISVRAFDALGNPGDWGYLYITLP